jgi:anthranilate synthase component 2
MYVLIDNYDSFTYNLVQYLGELGADVDVRRNDTVSVDEVIWMQPQAVIISPGPGVPTKSGICIDLVKAAAEQKLPVLGVCLGHQSIAEAFDGQIIRAPVPMHGKVSPITHIDHRLFGGIPSPFEATRYHSLIVDRDTLPDCFEITSETSNELIMGLSHRELPLHGVQFHPESIATECGHTLLKNFLALAQSGPNTSSKAV